jgi:hypothetical protein
MSELRTGLANAQPATPRRFFGHRVMASVLRTDQFVVCDFSIEEEGVGAVQSPARLFSRPPVLRLRTVPQTAQF